ncbi:hypothetical protein NLM59_07300 [Weeksellaceae bacterium KMM 9724]|nr:hypothetical protein [Profundicola chukchiensis]
MKPKEAKEYEEWAKRRVLIFKDQLKHEFSIFYYLISTASFHKKMKFFLSDFNP